MVCSWEGVRCRREMNEEDCYMLRDAFYHMFVFIISLYFQVKSFHCIVQVIWFVDLFFLSHEAFNTNRSLIWLSVFILVPKTTQLCAILALVTILTFTLNLSIWGVVFEDLLSVTSNLSTDSGANILGHSLPVFAINFDC